MAAIVCANPQCGRKTLLPTSRTTCPACGTPFPTQTSSGTAPLPQPTPSTPFKPIPINQPTPSAPLGQQQMSPIPFNQPAPPTPINQPTSRTASNTYPQ